MPVVTAIGKVSCFDALLKIDAAAMKPTALSLNILVAPIGTYKFVRAGYFSWLLFGPSSERRLRHRS